MTDKIKKKVDAFYLDTRVLKEILKRSEDDGRNRSDWLNRLLIKQFKIDSKPKSAVKNKVDEIVAGCVPCSNGTYDVLQSNVDTWAQAYPDVDIGSELNKVVAWLDSNPKKTVNGCKKFLNGWLNRAQNSVKSAGNNKQFSAKTSGNLSACEEFING